MENFIGVSWNPEDLNSSKQALIMLFLKGVYYDTLYTLNFGALDVASVIDEYLDEYES